MNSRAIVPLSQLERRAPEAGRIRLGEKTAKAMRAIETFRFTSPHRSALEQLADLYGGSVVAWSDPKARVANQFELKSDTSTIEVFLPANGLDVAYELWSGGGCTRRCDGETCEVPGNDSMEMVPCICAKKGVAECRPYTRMNVVLPGVDFYGTWRLESKGWNAAKELPGMYDMIAQFAQRGEMVRAYCHLEKRKSVQNGKTKNFVTPTLSMSATPDELLAGGGQPRAAISPGTQPAIEQNADTRPQIPMANSDDDVIEAEIVEEKDLVLESRCRDIADAHGLDGQKFVDAVWADTDGDLSKIEIMVKRATEGKVVPKSITPQGTVQWLTT